MSLYSDLNEVLTPYAQSIKGKADKSTTYTKTEVDALISEVEVETDTTLGVSGAPADAAETGRRMGLIKADLDAQDRYSILLNDEVPNTTQNYTFTNGRVSQVTHSRNSVAVRTDVFTYGTGTITEVRTLASGESLTIVTNLTTLETTITYTEA